MEEARGAKKPYRMAVLQGNDDETGPRVVDVKHMGAPSMPTSASTSTMQLQPNHLRRLPPLPSIDIPSQTSACLHRFWSVAAGPDTRRQLVSDALAQDDNEDFLKKVRERMERCGQDLIGPPFLAGGTAGRSRWMPEQRTGGSPDV